MMQKKFLCLGLTGSIACGKNAAAKIMTEYGIVEIDADKVYHKLLESDDFLKKALKNEFGNEIFDEHNRVNRKILGSIVYNKDSKMARLTRITHPLIIDAVKKNLLVNDSPKVINASLLIEMKMHLLTDEIILITLDKEEQIKRLCLRDGISRDYALIKIQAQMSSEEKKKYAHHIIDNSKSLDDLRKKIKALLLKKNLKKI
jgi:dephospho-CoA kinase